MIMLSTKFGRMMENGDKKSGSFQHVPSYIEAYSVTNWDIFVTFVSIIMRLVNVILNISLAVDYYKNNELNYFVWTACCILIPMVVTTVLSISMYVQDKNQSIRKQHNALGFIYFVIILPFFCRYCQSLSYAISSRKAERRNDFENQKKYFKLMIKEESDVALIRIFECFLETVPQKVLQLTIILQQGPRYSWFQFATIGSCFGSMAWCMVVYHKYVRYSQADKDEISICGVIGQCCWHFSIAVSRVLCMSLIASIFTKWTLIAFSIRVLLTSILLLTFDKPYYCSQTIFHSFIFTIILGIVYIFTYIIPKEGRTRYRFTVYYTFCILENIACITLAIIYAKSTLKESRFFIPYCVFAIGMYFFGIIFMIVYYKYCHPKLSQGIQLEVPGLPLE